MKTIKITNEKLFIALIFILFLFGFPFRTSFFNGYFKFLNIPFFIILFLLININRKNINIKKLFLCLLFFLITILSDLIYGVTVERFIIYFCMNTIPLLLLCIDWNNVNISVNSLKKIIKIYNIFIILITIMYILDLFTSCKIMKFIAGNFVPYVLQWLPQDGQSLFGMRYATFLGQYLHTSYIYIVFYLLNSYFNSKVDKNNQILKNYLIIIISIIGVLSSGSKVGFLLLTLSMIIFNAKKVKAMISLILLTLVLYFFGAFNLLLNRLQNESFSTGRFEFWEKFLTSGFYKIRLFFGLGDCFSQNIQNTLGRWVMEIVQELPFVIMLYKEGIVGTLIFILLLYVSPILNIKNDIMAKFSITVLFLVINSYNGVLVTPDTLILYIFSTILIMLISSYKKSNRIEVKYENSNNDLV